MLLQRPVATWQVHVHVRVSDGRPGVQQGAQCGGDGGHHLLQVAAVSRDPNFIYLLSISRSFPEGDIISWAREPWRLRSPWNRSEAEVLDLERDVCAPKDRGYFMVPQKITFEESRHICKKLTGAPISYTDKAEFESIVHFLSLSSNMRAPGCGERLGDGSTNLQVWAGGSDEAREGVWTTWDTNKEIDVTLIIFQFCF